MNDASATSLSLPAVKPATVMVHLGSVLVGEWSGDRRTEDGCFGNENFGDRDVFRDAKELCSESFEGGDGRESHCAATPRTPSSVRTTQPK